MDHVPRTSGLLWLLAAFGIYLYIDKTYRAPQAAGTAKTPVIHPVMTLGGNFAAWWPLLLHLLGALLFLAIVVLLALLGVRLWTRRRRYAAMELDEIILGPDDTAQPAEVMAALDAIHGQLLTRYGSAALGQVAWTFEILRDLEGGIHFVLGAPHGWLAAIEDIWRSKYTNIRFQPYGYIPRSWPVAQQIGLTQPWTVPTATVTTYTNSVMETVVQALDRAEGEVHLQFLMMPVPAGAYHAALRQHVRRTESDTRQAQGFALIADTQPMRSAFELYGKSPFQVEIRLAADDWQTMQRVYGALAEANGENRLKAATVVMGKRWWTHWLDQRVPSLWLFRPIILFSYPLATLIHLPSARLRINSLNRQLVRRGPAPRTISRNPALALLRDESGLVGLLEADRKYNILLVGSQGAGKSTDLLNIVKVDARQPKTLVLIDIGKDTAKRALGMIPTDRTVLWVDPSDPDCPWAINPLGPTVSEDAIANDVLEDLTQVFGDDAIRARSREFLGNAVLAIRDVFGAQGDLLHVYKMLTDEDFRTRCIQQLQDDYQRQYWRVTFARMVEGNPRFLEESLSAPRNKLDEVLRNQAVRAFFTAGPERQMIDFTRVIAERQVLIVNLDKSKLGKAGARLLGVMMVTMLWQALQGQTDLPEADRVPVSLILDEAQNFISEGFLDILAEGRGYGAQTTVAVRFLQEITSERAILGLQSLAQNLMVHQFEQLEEAKIFMQRFMRVWANMVTTADESQDAINFGADDFMRLPKYYAVCRWMVNGTPQPAFLAQTIPWEDAYSAEADQYHRAHQPRKSAVPPPFKSGGDSEYPATQETTVPTAEDPQQAPPSPDPAPSLSPEAASPQASPGQDSGAPRSDPAVWQAFTEKFHMTEAAVQLLAVRYGLSGPEVEQVLQWALKTMKSGQPIHKTLITVFEKRQASHQLWQLGDRLQAPPAAVRAALKTLGWSASDALTFCADHPEITTAEALTTAGRALFASTRA